MGLTAGLITENVGHCRNWSQNGLRKFLNPSKCSAAYVKMVKQYELHFWKLMVFLVFPLNVCACAWSTKIVNIMSYGYVIYSGMSDKWRSDNQDSTVPWTYWKVLISIQQVWVLRLPQSSPYVKFGIPDMLEASECYCTQPQTWCTPRRNTHKVMQDSAMYNHVTYFITSLLNSIYHRN